MFTGANVLEPCQIIWGNYGQAAENTLNTFGADTGTFTESMEL